MFHTNDHLRSIDIYDSTLNTPWKCPRCVESEVNHPDDLCWDCIRDLERDVIGGEHA